MAIANTVPIYAMAGALYFLKESMHPIEALNSLLSVVGLMLIIVFAI